MVLLLLSITVSNKLHALSLAKRGTSLTPLHFFPKQFVRLCSIIKMVKNDRKGNQEFFWARNKVIDAGISYQRGFSSEWLYLRKGTVTTTLLYDY